MKETINKLSDLTRISPTELRRVFSLLRLITSIEAINNRESENDKMKLEIPTFGEIVVSEDLDFEFIPDMDFKKDLYQIKQNPEEFLKRELEKTLKLFRN